MLGLEYATIIGAILLLSLTVYGLTGGADFGGGVWDLLARGRSARAQRDLIARTLGPIWEANHVWLILVVVLLFVCFPLAFSAFMTALHIPIALMLVGITLRGAAFVFRAYGRDSEKDFRVWSRVFAISSTVTPFFLGVTLGAAISGRIGVDIDTGVIDTDFVSAWLAPFPLALGVMVTVLFAFLAAVYLTHETRDEVLQSAFGTRAIAASLTLAATAVVAGLLSRDGAPHLWAALTAGPPAWLFQGCIALVALGVMVTLRARRYLVARLLAGLQTVLLTMGWGLAQGDQLIVGQLTIHEAAAPDSVLRPVTIALLAGMVVLVPSFVYLYRVFAGSKEATDG